MNKQDAWEQLMKDLKVEDQGLEYFENMIIDLITVGFDWGWQEGYNQAMLDYNVEVDEIRSNYETA